MIANSLCYNPILGFVKASMILLYLRLGGTKDGVRIACYLLLFINFALTISIFAADALQCLPFEYNWNALAMDLAAQKAAGANEPGMTPYGPVPSGFKDGRYVTGGKCFNQIDFLMIAAGLTIFTDLLILAIPIYMVYDLQMKRKKKLTVIIILCMGIWQVQRIFFNLSRDTLPRALQESAHLLTFSHSAVSQQLVSRVYSSNGKCFIQRSQTQPTMSVLRYRRSKRGLPSSLAAFQTPFLCFVDAFLISSEASRAFYSQIPIHIFQIPTHHILAGYVPTSRRRGRTTLRIFMWLPMITRLEWTVCTLEKIL